jgi:hypothetical protein
MSFLIVDQVREEVPLDEKRVPPARWYVERAGRPEFID